VARDETAFHGSLVQWEAHVRATILDGVGAPVVPEDHDGKTADLGDELPVRAEVFERSGADRDLFHATSFR
jgi:hypothetical protein